MQFLADGRRVNIGFFQKAALEAKKVDFIFARFNNKTPDQISTQPALAENDNVWNVIVKYCECKKLVPSKFKKFFNNIKKSFFKFIFIN